MGTLLTHMGFGAAWMALGAFVLVLSVLLLVRALFPDFTGEDPPRSARERDPERHMDHGGS